MEPTSAPTDRPRASRRERACVWLVAALFVGRGLLYWGFVPIWDGRIYANCVLDLSASCAGHPTAAHLGLLMLSQLFDRGGYHGILLLDLLLGAGALVAFHALLLRLDPRPEHALARALAVAALSTHPVLLASAVNLTPDYGLTAFFVVSLWALVARRYVLAALFGLAAAFSKEPGIVVYGTAVAANELLLLARDDRPWRERLAGSARRAVLVLPAIAMGAYLVARLRSGGLWNHESATSIGTALLTTGFGVAQRGYLFWIFLAQFQWVLLAPIVLAVAIACWRGLSRASSGALLVAAVLAAGAYVMTRYVTFSNPRYFLPLAPVLLAAGYLACVALPWPRWAAAATLAAVTALFAASSVRTVDPVTKTTYGTFPFGRHELLRTTSVTRECCGYGRDQLAYNLEFTELHRVLNEVYAALPTEREPVLASPLANFWLDSNLDDQHRRVMRGGRFFMLRSPHDVADWIYLPPRIHFIALPYVDDAPSIAVLERQLVLNGRRRFEHDGYALDLYTFSPRAGDRRASLP